MSNAGAEDAVALVDQQWVQVDNVVMSAVLEARDLSVGTEVQFVGEIQPGIGPLFVDGTRIVQALTGVVLTAARFSDKGIVPVRATLPADQGSRLRIEVETSGEGLPWPSARRSSMRSRALKSARRQGGLGIGLQLALGDRRDPRWLDRGRQHLAWWDGVLCVAADVERRRSDSLAREPPDAANVNMRATQGRSSTRNRRSGHSETFGVSCARERSLPSVAASLTLFAASSLILRVDAGRARRRAEALEEVDFTDRSIAAYASLALLAGALPLVVYFWSTRRNARGVLIGLAWAFGASAVGALVFVGVASVMSRPRYEMSFAPAGPVVALRPIDPRVDAYLPALREVAANAAPRCARHEQEHVDATKSPAAETALEHDAKVLQVGVWCIRPSYKVAFATLGRVSKDRQIGGTWPQNKVVGRDPDADAVVTLFLPSSEVRDANRIDYVSRSAVEVTVDLEP